MKPSEKISEATDLEAIDKRREKDRSKSKVKDMFVVMSRSDWRSYKKLMRFVKPYRVKIALSIVLAAAAGVLLASQLWIMKQGLASMMGTTQSETHACPECATDLVVSKADESAESEWLSRYLDRGEEAPAEAGEETPAEPSSDKSFVIRTEAHDHPAHGALTAEQESRKISGLYVIAAVLVLAVVLEGFCKYFQAVLMATASRRVVMDLRLHVFQHIMGMSIRFHQSNHSAKLISRITHDMTLFGRFLTQVTVRILREFFSFVALVAFIIMEHGHFIFVVGGIIAVGMIPIQVAGRRIRKGNKASQAGMAEIYTFLTEALNGQRVVKAFGGEEREYERFKAANDLHLKHILKIRRLRAGAEAIVPVIAALGVGAVIVVGGQKVLSGQISAPSFMIIIAALGRAMASMRVISKQLNDVHIGLSAVDRISTLLAVEPDIADQEGAVELPPFRKAIRYEGVSFRHRSDELTLERIRLTIKKGERVALVGPSGAGKSTIADLLPRFFDPKRGRITIDGHDLREVTLESLRSQIGIVTQETLLFRDSVADNIAYGRPDASREDIIEAAKAANAHHFVEKLPEGYDTLLGEKGHSLSGGERQRIAIARALLRNPPILILDEATSALDSESEAQVQNALRTLMKNRTVIMIAHRLSTVHDCDRIVVLEDGRIVEKGTHGDLMEGDGGVYRRLYELQSNAMNATQGG